MAACAAMYITHCTMLLCMHVQYVWQYVCVSMYNAHCTMLHPVLIHIRMNLHRTLLHPWRTKAMVGSL